MKKPEVVKLLSFINTSYVNNFSYGEDDIIDDMMESTWHDFLKDYDYKVIASAAKKHIINEPNFPPNPGHLVNIINEMGKTETEKESWKEAWKNTIQLIRDHGVQFGYKEIKEGLSDRALKAAEMLGGLEYIAMLPDKEISYAQNRYKEIYNNIKARAEDRKALPPSHRQEVERLSEGLRGNTPQLKGANNDKA